MAVPQPVDWAERRDLAEYCCTTLKLSIPCVVDSIGGAVDNLYSGFPDRIFVIDREGRIAYAGKPGPWGFDPVEAEKVLATIP